MKTKLAEMEEIDREMKKSSKSSKKSKVSKKKKLQRRNLRVKNLPVRKIVTTTVTMNLMKKTLKI